MSEKENENKANLNSFDKEQQQAQLNLKRIEQYEQQLKNDKRFQEYASAFSKHSVESFIKDFASQKVRWMEWGNKYAEWKEKDDLEWQTRAAEMITQIQQKKLFDLQCQWRAENITLDRIEICYDFLMWEGNVMACPVISDITDDELEMYFDYLKSTNYQTLNRHGVWQNYDDLKEAYHSDNSSAFYPEWYSYYDSKMGTSAFLLLPDIKGEKECFYIELAETEKNEKPAEAVITAPVNSTPANPRKPSLDYHKHSFIKEFINRFDTAQTAEYFEAFSHAGKSVNEEVNKAVSLLSQAENIISIRKNKNWTYALFESAAELVRQKCIEVFPAVCDEYRIYRETKLENPQPDPYFLLMFSLDRFKREAQKQKILRGRVLNGEPADLNF